MDFAARLGAPHPYLTGWQAEVALLTYEATAEVARLLGSERVWPQLERLDEEGLVRDYQDVLRLRYSRRRPVAEEDDDAD